MDGRYFKRGVYEVYKGGECIAKGTIEELSKQFGIEKRSVKYWVTPRNAKLDKGNRKVAVNIGTVGDLYGKSDS